MLFNLIVRGFNNSDGGTDYDSILFHIDDKLPNSRYPDNPAVYFDDINKKFIEKKSKADIKSTSYKSFIKKINQWIDSSEGDKVDIDNVVQYGAELEKKIKQLYYTFDEEERDAIDKDK